MGKSYETHDFYCLNCGLKSLPICRDCGRKRESFHRKRLYCFHCKQEVNHIEIKNQEEKNEFLEAFENGEFREEATQSLNYVRTAGLR